MDSSTEEAWTQSSLDLSNAPGAQSNPLYHMCQWMEENYRSMEIIPAKDEPTKTTLFTQEQSGVTYRIPALIYISHGQTFLAFAEKRKSANDRDAEILVMRRGTQKDGTLTWSPVRELSTARLPDHRTMNPCPVYERKTKTLFLFFICVLGRISEQQQICTGKNKARLCYVTSKDNGLTWSDTTDLTEILLGCDVHNWATFAVGPGHGIQMTSGQLIIPAYVYYIESRWPCCKVPRKVRSHAFAFSSDDLGKTWHAGKRVKTESCECEMAEIIDQECVSRLYCNARSTKGHRVEALSVNGGAIFDGGHFAKELVETHRGCQGSVLSFSAPEQSQKQMNTSSVSNTDKTWLVYSHPTNKKKREDLGVYLNKSPLSTSAWNITKIINRGPSGYSDLTRCQEPDRFACLMECGEKSELEKIAFVEFSLRDITSNE